MEFKDLVGKLAKLGFSEYEARAYISLLKSSPVTGYELAKNSSVPLSKVYDVVKKLLDRSLVSPLEGKPVKYVPQNRRSFLKNLRQNFNETMSYLEKNLPSHADKGYDFIWNVEEMGELINKAMEMIRAASKEVILLGWDTELQVFMELLEKKSRSLRIAIIQFGSMKFNVGAVYPHGVEKVLEREKAGRLFTLAVDGSRLLHGIISQAGQVRAIYSSHPGLVELGMDYMKHEIYTTKMYEKFPQMMDEVFGGKDLKKLRNIWKP